MASPAITAASDNAGRLYAVVKSIREFDKLELAGILSRVAALSPAPSESCFLATYYRPAGIVDSLLRLDNGTHFQAAAMLARSLFELAVDIKLVDKIPNGWMKMVFFVDVEKLRCARQMVAFRRPTPTVRLTCYRSGVGVSPKPSLSASKTVSVPMNRHHPSRSSSAKSIEYSNGRSCAIVFANVNFCRARAGRPSVKSRNPSKILAWKRLFSSRDSFKTSSHDAWPKVNFARLKCQGVCCKLILAPSNASPAA